LAPPATSSRDDGLVARYEELRQLALACRGVQAQGLALFIRRGMRAWMQAWSQCVPPSLPASAALPDAPQTCPAQLHAEVATLLASMVLFAPQEVLA
jgi:hypothetical protein